MIIITAFSCKAGESYHAYLVQKAFNLKYPHQALQTEASNSAGNLALPRYKIPMGSVFCRMEDKLIKATKVWITVGVK